MESFKINGLSDMLTLDSTDIYVMAIVGTNRTDNKFEKTVEKIALEVFPFETVEKTTADDTVVGKIASIQNPIFNSSFMKCDIGRISAPTIIGKII